MDPMRVALSLAGIVIIIIAAYYATWFISVKASGQSRGKLRNKNINLIDRFAISKDKSFCLVEIAGKVYVIGITNQSMTLLDTLDAAAFAEAGAEAESRNSQTWHLTPGGGFSGRITKRLAAFIAHKIGRSYEIRDDESGETFANSMKNARERSFSGQTDKARPKLTNDPEDEG